MTTSTSNIQDPPPQDEANEKQPADQQAAEDTDESVDSNDSAGHKEFSKPERTSLNMTASYDDYLKMLEGFTPRQMEDRWYITCKKIDPVTKRSCIRMSRSWTSYEDVRGEFFLLGADEPQDIKAPYIVFDRLWYETDPERRGERDVSEAKATFEMLLRGIGVIALDRDQVRTDEK